MPCNSQDHIYCRVLGFHAVDAAMAGYTGVELKMEMLTVGAAVNAAAMYNVFTQANVMPMIVHCCCCGGSVSLLIVSAAWIKLSEF